jgi:hypothetical protein
VEGFQSFSLYGLVIAAAMVESGQHGCFIALAMKQ